MPFEDIPAFLYFQGVLHGFPVRGDIKHIVIDEAQDYTSLQYKILARLFPNCSWTIVGDPVQAIQPYLKTVSFAGASEILAQESTALFRLSKSYRSTLQIQSFCNALLPQANNLPAVNRPGPCPRIVRLKTGEELNSQLYSAIQTALNDGWHSIGIICKNALQAESIFENLKDSTDLALITKEDDVFHRGVVVMPSYLAKGLEFDTVLVVDADSTHYQTEHDRHILYTVCTRALHRLEIYYTGDISSFIAEMEESLYCHS